MSDKTDEKQYSWMSEYPDGSVGVCGMLIGKTHTPMHFRDLTTAMGALPLAVMHREMTGQRVWLRTWDHYTDGEDLP